MTSINPVSQLTHNYYLFYSYFVPCSDLVKLLITVQGLSLIVAIERRESKSPFYMCAEVQLCFLKEHKASSVAMFCTTPHSWCQDPFRDPSLSLSLQVCRKLGIIEVDYFGLQFTGSKGENLWLNLRNRICQQMDNVAPCRLRLRVKFFVEPHLILQEQTRYAYHANTSCSLPNQLVTISVKTIS